MPDLITFKLSDTIEYDQKRITGGKMRPPKAKDVIAAHTDPRSKQAEIYINIIKLTRCITWEETPLQTTAIIEELSERDLGMLWEKYQSFLAAPSTQSNSTELSEKFYSTTTEPSPTPKPIISASRK